MVAGALTLGMPSLQDKCVGGFCSCPTISIRSLESGGRGGTSRGLAPRCDRLSSTPTVDGGVYQSESARYRRCLEQVNNKDAEIRTTLKSLGDRQAT